MITKLLGISMIGLLLLASACSDSPSSSDTDDNAGNPGNPSANEVPTAVADADTATVTVGEEVTLDASDSSDPDGDDLTYEWELNAPDGSSVQLSDDQAEKPTFTPDIAGDYKATLNVSDGNGGSAQDDVTVTAESNVVKISSDITEDQTWTADKLYRVMAYIDVRSGAKLTIEPGVTVEFATDAGISVSSDNSVLISAGTQEEP